MASPGDRDLLLFYVYQQNKFNHINIQRYFDQFSLKNWGNGFLPDSTSVLNLLRSEFSRLTFINRLVRNCNKTQQSTNHLYNSTAYCSPYHLCSPGLPVITPCCIYLNAVSRNTCLLWWHSLNCLNRLVRNCNKTQQSTNHLYNSTAYCKPHVLCSPGLPVITPCCVYLNAVSRNTWLLWCVVHTSAV